MEHVAQWTAHVFLYEHDTSTQARVELDTGSNVMIGVGVARRNPSDPEIPEIGDELAVARAVSDLAEQLLRAAGDDIRAMERLHAGA